MARTRECDYCGDDIEPGTGTMLVRVDGATVHYCSSKCEKNAELGREARNLEWTEAGGGHREQAIEDAETTETESVDEPAVTEESEAEEVAEEEDVGDGAAAETEDTEEAAGAEDGTDAESSEDEAEADTEADEESEGDEETEEAEA